MIPTLPVSHLIDRENYSSIPGIKALEYKEVGPIFGNELERIFHSNYGIMQKEFIGYFNGIVDFLNGNKFLLFSFDFGPAVEKVSVKDHYYVTESRILSKTEIQDKISENLDYVKKKFRGILAVENLNYFPTPAYEHVCEPDFLRHVIEGAGLYLVLDIAHAKISAHNLGYDVRQYLSSLPLDRVREVHLSAPGIKGDVWRDLHDEPGDDEYALLDFVRAKTVHGFYVTVEYYKDLAVLAGIYAALDKRYSVKNRGPKHAAL